MDAREVKVVLLGEAGVGKSSLVLRFVMGTFDKFSEATIGAAFMSKLIEVDKVPIKYQIWDTAGGYTLVLRDSPPLFVLLWPQRQQPCPRPCAAIYTLIITRALFFPNHSATQITNTHFSPPCKPTGQEKYHSLAPMYYRGAAAAIIVYDITKAHSFQTLKTWVKELHQLGPENIVLAVCGNMADKESERAVSKEEASEYAREIGAIFVETSAKLNKGVNEVFSELSRRLPQQADAGFEGVADLRDNQRGSGGGAAGKKGGKEGGGCC
jgi:GTPase SAR1 family protein